MKNCGVEHSLYEKCHHNNIYETLSLNIPFPPLILGSYGVLKMQILSVFKSQLTILTEIGLSKSKLQQTNAKFYQKHY